jgi:Methyltransferase FkbM domain
LRPAETAVPLKSESEDFIGRFREIISDPINILIRRVPEAGVVEGDFVYLHNGNRVASKGMNAYYGEFSLILSLNRGVHEPLEEYVFQETVKRLSGAPVMLELGSYWAHYSMWLKKKCPDASVFMVEPDECNIAVGKFNFLTNGFSGEFIQDFVSEVGFVVDEFRLTRGLSIIDVLHADIQGNELQMLQGCTESLARRAIKYIFVSTHSQELHMGVTSFLQRMGYRVEVSSDFDYETTSNDGLVFASSPSVRSVFKNFRPLGRIQIAGATPEELLKSLMVDEPLEAGSDS